MISIWAVDDSESDLQKLQQVLSDFLNQKKMVFEFRAFTDGQSVLNAAADDCADLIFMDIEIGQENGLTISKALRKNSRHTQIALLSSFPSYSIDGYLSGASRFFVKPVSIEQLEKGLDADYLQQLDSNTSFFDARIAEVPLSAAEILYIESEGRRTSAWYISGRKIESRLTLREWAGLLASRQSFFVQCYKSILVNAQHIEDYDAASRDLILKGGLRIPCSRHFRKDVEAARRKVLCAYL